MRKYNVKPLDLENSEYCKCGNLWWFKSPNGILFHIDVNNPNCHRLTEHEDGTISLSPSILLSPGSCGIEEGYHGFLKRGVWRLA